MWLLPVFGIFSSVLWSAGSPTINKLTNDRPILSIGIMADVQYCDCETANNRHYRQSLEKLDEIVAVFEEREVDFVVSLGDLIDRDYSSFFPVLEKLAWLSVPVYHVLGNHDFSVEADFLEAVPPALGLENRYYSSHFGDLRLVFLDGNDMSLFANVVGTPEHRHAERMMDSLKAIGAPNAQSWNGGLGDQQLDWLVGELESARAMGEWVILFCHYPLFPEGDAHNLWDEARGRRIISDYPNVVAYFNGHQHRGSYHSENGVHFLNFKGVVEGETNAFAVVDFYADRLVVTGYGREESRILELPYVKTSGAR